MPRFPEGLKNWKKLIAPLIGSAVIATGVQTAEAGNNIDSDALDALNNKDKAAQEASDASSATETPAGSPTSLEGNLNSVGLTMRAAEGTLTPPPEADPEMQGVPTIKLTLWDTQDGSSQDVEFQQASDDICNLLNVPENERSSIKIVAVPLGVNIRNYPSTETGEIVDRESFPSAEFVAQASTIDPFWWEAQCVLVPLASGRGSEIVSLDSHVFFHADYAPATGEPSFPEQSLPPVEIAQGGATSPSPDTQQDQPGLPEGGSGAEPPTEQPTGTDAPGISNEELESMGTLTPVDAGATQPAAIVDGEPTPLVLENVPMINGVPVLATPGSTPELRSAWSFAAEISDEVSQALLRELPSWEIREIHWDAVPHLYYQDREIPWGLIQNPGEYGIQLPRDSDAVAIAGVFQGIHYLEDASSRVRQYGYLVSVPNSEGQTFVHVSATTSSHATTMANFAYVPGNLEDIGYEGIATQEVVNRLEALAPLTPIIIVSMNDMDVRPGYPEDEALNKYRQTQRELVRRTLQSGQVVDSPMTGLGQSQIFIVPR